MSLKPLLLLFLSLAIVPAYQTIKIEGRRQAGQPSTKGEHGFVSKMAELETAVVAICHTKASYETMLGTGFIVSERGLIITADHVVVDEGTNKSFSSLYAVVPRQDGVTSVLELELLKRFRESSTGRDVAALRVKGPGPASRFKYLRIGVKVKTGDPVVIAGYPLIFDRPYFWPIFRSGIVSSTRYSYEGAKIFILDLGAVGGFSGSPVVRQNDLSVIGVVKGGTSRAKDSGFTAAFTLEPSDLAKLEQ